MPRRFQAQCSHTLLVFCYRWGRHCLCHATVNISVNFGRQQLTSSTIDGEFLPTTGKDIGRGQRLFVGVLIDRHIFRGEIPRTLISTTLATLSNESGASLATRHLLNVPFNRDLLRNLQIEINTARNWAGGGVGNAEAIKIIQGWWVSICNIETRELFPILIKCVRTLFHFLWFCFGGVGNVQS